MGYMDHLARIEVCRTCAAEIVVAFCRDGRWRGFDQTEMPAGTPGSWAWRNREGMVETDVVPGNPLHYCHGQHKAAAPSHTAYTVITDMPAAEPENG